MGGRRTYASFCIPECDKTKRLNGGREAKWPLKGVVAQSENWKETKDTVKR